jgi:hypothetical protein
MPATDWPETPYSHEPMSTYLIGSCVEDAKRAQYGARTSRWQAPVWKTSALLDLQRHAPETLLDRI